MDDDVQTKVVEVRLGVTVPELTQDQVFGLLRGLDAYEPSVGLGYAGEAAVVFLDVHPEKAATLSEQAAEFARELGLTPSLVEVLDPDVYEVRALAELESDLS